MKIAIVIIVIVAWACQGSIIKSKGNEEQDSLEVLVKKTIEAITTTAVKQVRVTAPEPKVRTDPNKAAHLFCDYSISTGEDLPVTVTWKVGDGPRNAHDIYRCVNYTKSSGICQDRQTLDAKYKGRLILENKRPNLFFTKVLDSDNGNYWCQISLQGKVKEASKGVGMDMKSVGLEVMGDYMRPKFHTVEIDDNVVTHVGEQAILHCICTGSHCSDVVWYKGPSDYDNTQYHLVYSRKSYSRPTPTQYQAYGEWVGKAHLSGNSLVIDNTQQNNSGRYWCEIRAVGYYGIGEMGTDAKSTVLEVHKAGSTGPKTFSCLGLYDGLYPDPESCTHYYNCHEGRTAHFSCAAGTVFKPDSATCDFAYNVLPPCGTKGQ